RPTGRPGRRSSDDGGAAGARVGGPFPTVRSGRSAASPRRVGDRAPLEWAPLTGRRLLFRMRTGRRGRRRGALWAVRVALVVLSATAVTGPASAAWAAPAALGADDWTQFQGGPAH